MIDAHVHVWRLGQNDCSWPTRDLTAIYRDYDLSDVGHIIAGSGVDQVVLVQSQPSERDTLWLLDEAAASSLAAGVVGWLDPHADRIATRIKEAQARGPLAGLRVMAQDHDADWLDRPELRSQYAAMDDAGLALDLLVRPRHLPSSIALATRYPSLRMVIDHCAKPEIAAGELASWHEKIAPAADRPNMMCKLSGLITEAGAGASLECLIPYVEAALALFGPDRLIWGSDWPVIGLDGDYRAWLDFARSVVPDRHHESVFGGAARCFYRLA